MIDITNARVEIGYEGTTHTAEAKDGKDLGDFTSDIGSFTQKNIAVEIEALRMTIFFRPDTTSDRFEVVFELGQADDPAPVNMDAYVATVFIGTTQLVSVNVPAHYWACRWRWQSEVRPPVRKISDIPEGQLPPMRDAKKKPPKPPKPPTETTPPPETTPPETTPPSDNTGVVFEPMGLAGVTPYMPGTGERDDIGLVTGVQGVYMDSYMPEDFTLMMQQAEASASIPWHIREPATKGLYDCDAHPTATLYGEKPGQWEYIAQATNPVTIDIAHQPDLCYVPYLMTGDPYFLEEMQFATNHSMLASPPDARYFVGQTRGYAWMLRNVSQCAAVTPTAAPTWLMSKTQWTNRLDQHLAYFTTNYLQSSDPVIAVLRTADGYAASRDEGPTNPAGTHTAPWQDEFMATVFGWIVDLGFSSWEPVFDWQIGSTIARTNGCSGWPKEVATPYRMNVCMSAGAPLATCWDEAWANTQELQGIEIPVQDQLIPGSDTWYMSYTRAALTYAKRAGYDVSAALAWMNSEVQRFGVDLTDKKYAKWALRSA